MKRGVVWFKTNLRIEDNPVLNQALSTCDEVIPVYCFDENHFTSTTFGFQKTGSFRTQFLLESLVDLDNNLRKLGTGLYILRGNPTIEISKIVQEYAVSSVFVQDEFVFEELQTQQQVASALQSVNCSLVTIGTCKLYDVQDLPFSITELPDIFTNFRKKVEACSSVGVLNTQPIELKSPTIKTNEWPSLASLGINEPIVDERAVLKFKGGETAAWQRLHHYFYQTQALSSYKETRNGMIGADYSSKFSAWLALGCISPKSIYYEIKKYELEFGANESTYWLYFELLWRDYFQFVMMKYQQRLFLKNGIQSNKKNDSVTNQSVVAKWINGQTGNDFVDAHMIELKQTGYMSNRGRQNVASYFCHYLHQDWRVGAAYFEQQLIDYDVSSNWGNWAYLAGFGNDPRPNRIFNIDKQAHDYDANKTYRNLWLNII
jgi:deoxyribodipyrimidine photo-lyase